MTPTEIVDSAMGMMRKDEAQAVCVRLHKGKCQITDTEGFPYGDAATGYDPKLAEVVASTLRERGYRVDFMAEHTSFRGSPMLEDYRRLIGVAPSMVEKTMGSDKAMLAALSKAFTAKVKKADVPFIRYRDFKGEVEMEDTQGRLGGVLTSLGPKEADLAVLKAWLKKHGAKAVKKFTESTGGVFTTGDPKVDKVVSWLLSKAKRTKLRDGTVNSFFRGKLPKGMVLAVSRSSKLQHKDAGKEMVYHWSGSTGDFAIAQGTRMSTQYRVRFTANDYTVPAAKG